MKINMHINSLKLLLYPVMRRNNNIVIYTSDMVYTISNWYGTVSYYCYTTNCSTVVMTE